MTTAEIGPIQEGGPVERLLSFHARLGQQFCDAGDPPAIDGRNDPGAQIEALLRTLQTVQATIQERRKKPVTPAKVASGMG